MSFCSSSQFFGRQNVHPKNLRPCGYTLASSSFRFLQQFWLLFVAFPQTWHHDFDFDFKNHSFFFHHKKPAFSSKDSNLLASLQVSDPKACKSWSSAKMRWNWWWKSQFKSRGACAQNALCLNQYYYRLFFRSASLPARISSDTSKDIVSMVWFFFGWATPIYCWWKKSG